MRVPDLLDGRGRAIRADAVGVTSTLGEFDLAYLDPPYNQHRYFTNYHIWETLVRWDEPEVYGVARKRVDSRDEATKSVMSDTIVCLGPETDRSTKPGLNQAKLDQFFAEA